MPEFYTNLPPKDKDDLQKTIDKLTTTAYETEYQFNAGEYDATIAYFVNRGFKRASAESISYIIMSQARIDGVSSREILDKLANVDDAKLSEIITIILNANRYKSSRLGVRQTLTTTETVSRNIID